MKEEPPEQDQTTQRTIGELITQSDYIAKAIKQELIDTTAAAWAITHKHSPTCDLNKYIEMHGGIGSLQIEDVRSLVRADQAVFLEMTPVQIETEPSSAEGTQEIASTLPMVPPDHPTALHVVTNTNSNITDPPSQDASADSSTINTPLPVVTSASTTTSSSTLASTDSSSIPLMMDKPTPLKWSRVLNRPVEADPIIDTMSADTPPTSKSTLPVVTSKADDISIEDPQTTTTIDRYYEVLNPEQDDVVFISHAHIMNSICTVQLERFSDDTQDMLKAGRSEPSPQSSSTETTETSDSVTPKKKPCYRP